MSLTEIKSSNVNDRVINLLESCLADAREGNILSLAIAAVHLDATTSNGFVAEGRPIALIGETEVLKRDLIDCNIDLRMHDSGREY